MDVIEQVNEFALMDTPELPIGDEHPLNLELKSLRSAVERYQVCYRSLSVNHTCSSTDI